MTGRIMGAWNPEAYLKFEDERTRPSHDLIARIRIDDPTSAVDLGCGPGNSTQALLRRWPEARVTGIDSSPDMIEAARTAYPDQDWVLADIETWTSDARFDLVFSNAALQWVTGHEALLGRLFEMVAPDGALAFQMPSDAYAKVRALIHEVADDPAWAERMGDARRALTMEPPQVYYDVLAPIARAIDMWETEYYHLMESPAAIVEWISSTGLRPFLDALEADEERRRFVSTLEARVAESYGRRSDGRVLFPFRRLFFIAYA